MLRRDEEKIWGTSGIVAPADPPEEVERQSASGIEPGPTSPPSNDPGCRRGGGCALNGCRTILGVGTDASRGEDDRSKQARTHHAGLTVSGRHARDTTRTILAFGMADDRWSARGARSVGQQTEFLLASERFGGPLRDSLGRMSDTRLQSSAGAGRYEQQRGPGVSEVTLLLGRGFNSVGSYVRMSG